MTVISKEQESSPEKVLLRLERGKDKTYWSEQLTRFRNERDLMADRLVSKHLGEGEAGRKNYNRVMQTLSYIIEDAGRLLVQRSKLREEYGKAGNEELVDYFMPMPAPDWINTEKLARASRLWSTYTIPMMGVLYAGSLPSCYLIFRGIPALYATTKLKDANYLTQRLYETGLMLEEVLSGGGLAIIGDVVLDSEGNPNFENSGDKDRNYLWGKGYLTARKVRFLHAAIRYKLLHTSAFPHSPIPEGMSKPFGEALAEKQSWDAVTLGEPINQEDMAYTLLTFGLLIPKGLEKWGVTLEEGDAAAFLHLWNLVGYIMGVDERLLTDDVEEAQFLFDLVQERQAGPSEEGKLLTKALIDHLSDYLPTLPGIPDNALPVKLILSQIKPGYAEFIIPHEQLQRSEVAWRWPLYKGLSLGAKIYFLLRGGMMSNFPMWGALTTGLLREAGASVIDAWRSAYRRQPFFVPDNLTTWKLKQGATEQFLVDLRNWRRQVLLRTGLAVLMLVSGMVLSFLSIPLLLFQESQNLGVLFLIFAGIDWLVFARFVKRGQKQLLDNRPKLSRLGH